MMPAVFTRPGESATVTAKLCIAAWRVDFCSRPCQWTVWPCAPCMEAHCVRRFSLCYELFERTRCCAQRKLTRGMGTRELAQSGDKRCCRTYHRRSKQNVSTSQRPAPKRRPVQCMSSRQSCKTSREISLNPRMNPHWRGCSVSSGFLELSDDGCDLLNTIPAQTDLRLEGVGGNLELLHCHADLPGRT